MIPPLEKRHKIEIGDPQAVTVLLAGCGGTGSFAALHLARLAYEARRSGGMKMQLVFVDPDTVEAKNIGRQNFAPCEIGLPKAIALATRYNLAFGLEIGAAVATFEKANLVEVWKQNRWDSRSLMLIIGCVDSPAARCEIEAAVKVPGRNTWWLDAGNDEHSGQVLLGNGPKAVIDPTLGCVGLPWPSLQEPGIVEVDGRQQMVDGDGLSCAELMALNAQSLMINQAMAGWLGTYVYRLLLGRDLDTYQTWVDLRGGNVRSMAVTEGEAVAVKAARATPEVGVIEVDDQEIADAIGHIMDGIGLCPTCNATLTEGRDVLNEEIGEEDIVFCPQCGFREALDVWEEEQQAINEEAEAQARAAMIAGVRARRELGPVEVG